jgi:A/G-specific adenine glycosylase
VTRGAGKSTADPPFETAAVAGRLLDWYGQHGRDLPWRKTRDPYRIWLSEIMLQQTTVAAVIPYYERFLQAFPTLRDLAQASLDDVIQLWAGLGYYSRARNLHQAALKVVEEFYGQFPASLAELMSLPGVGRSTAGAILSIAFDLPAPILDGNVRRVLVRLFAWDEDPRSGKADKQLWLWAGQLTPADRPHDYAQAIMDLGATVCTPRDPACPCCPLQEFCQARRLGRANQLPARRRKKIVPVRQQAALLIRSGNDLKIRKRPPSGLLGGLWEFPVVDVTGDMTGEGAIQALLDDSGLQGKAWFVGSIDHVYSHFKLQLAVYAVDSDALHVAAESEDLWLPVDELAEAPLHGAHQKALQLYSKVLENTDRTAD